MKNREDLTRQAVELISSGQKVLDTETARSHSSPAVNEVKFHEYRISALSFLSRVFTVHSTHYQSFKAEVTHATASRTRRGIGILESAKEAISGEWFESTKGAITKDVLTGLLRQAKLQADQSNFKAAAIIAGAVLDETLRTLCMNQGIKLFNEIDGKAVPKNTLQLTGDAYKKKIYDRQTNKMMIGWIGLYYDAAENKEIEKISSKVGNLLNGVQSFLAKTQM